MKAAARLVLFSLVFAGALAAQAEPAAVDATPAYSAARARWQGELASFAAADRERQPAPGGVLFVGSSTIRMWSRLADDFRQQPVVINRGFGGSTMADCSLFAADLVVRYKPRLVLVYAGDNDLAEGRTPLQVLESFAQFASTVRAGLPDTRIAYISVKPSPSRAKLLPGVRETNHIIEAYLQRLPNSDYIDVYTPMMGADGRPRAELFRGDQLHLNDEGYRLWQSVIAAHLQPPEAAGTSIAQGAR
ncbi:SGNH/GDSL hydrolase family protein [Variovorax saccharolyticus]|uniref:SGNH/GDSL hydrolase family protein n=1 Tax=Variovorax saccharolyticus TaxID=3053516 RepID=UPI002578E30E|nr:MULTISPECIES: SGNH/GDSL hydrolase family protein [unclassified Variovorax]MDM0018642.1 SGNH/GDSL hydrolase family protein [Variovorax sp. J22R187]MDM0024166.1 SGNH/GDSL hydrolase family protein [Variovorax sp. J31P216]